MSTSIFEWIARHPRTVISSAAITVSLSAYAAAGIRVDYSVEQFFPRWGRERAVFDEYRSVFSGEDAQVAFFLATPNGLDTDAYSTLSRVADAFARHELADVRWVGVELGLGDSPPPEIRQAAARSAREDPLLRGVLSNDAGTVSVVQARLPEALNHDPARRTLVRALRDDIDALEVNARWALSGTPVIRADVPEMLERDQTVLLGSGIVLFFVILYAFFRHVGLTFVALAAVAPAYVVTLAVMALTGHPVSILTSFIPIVILVVGICDTIHVLEHWCRARAAGTEHIEAIRRTFDKLAVSCFFTSLTTALGFASLAATGIDVVADFGVFTAIAVLATYGFVVTLLPSLLALMDRPPRRVRSQAIRGPERAVVRGAHALLARRDGRVIPFFGLVAVVALALGSTLRVDTYLVDDLKEDARIKQDLRWIEGSGFGLFQTNLFIRADGDRLLSPEMVDWMERFQVAAAGEDIVLRSFGLPDVERALGAPAARAEGQLPGGLYDADRRAAQVVVTVKDAGSRRTLAYLDRLDDHLEHDPPPYGTADLTGTVRMAHTFSFHVLRSFGPSIALALALIFLVLSVLFRSAQLGLVAMVPNLLPLVVLAAVMALLGVPLKPSTILVFSIAFGIAVDDSIHLMSRFQQLLAHDRSLDQALHEAVSETGPALVMSTLVVSAGFSLLLLSQFELLYLLGLLTAVTAVSALAADLLLFPALVQRLALPAARPATTRGTESPWPVTGSARHDP
jgi:predicted RND superfamily exporter protein